MHQEEKGVVPTSQAASEILTKFLLSPPPAEAEVVEGYCTQTWGLSNPNFKDQHDVGVRETSKSL